MKAGAVGAKVKELVDARRAKGMLQRHCYRSAKWRNQQKIKKLNYIILMTSAAVSMTM